MLSLVRTQLEQLPESERADAAIGTLKRLFLNDFYLFSRFFLCYKDITKAAHSEMISVFESRATRKIIVEPRGTFKSTLGSVAYPIWRLLRDPNLTILLDSELYTNSKNFIREIKGNLDSERMRLFFGEQKGSKWDEAEITIKTRTRNIKEASFASPTVSTDKIVRSTLQQSVEDGANALKLGDVQAINKEMADLIKYQKMLTALNGEKIGIGKVRHFMQHAIGTGVGYGAAKALGTGPAGELIAGYMGNKAAGLVEKKAVGGLLGKFIQGSK